VHSDFFQNNILILDGAMGTVLQQRGLPPGGQPELLNLTNPDLLISVYRDYIDAGSQVIYANTFGANGLKLGKTRHTAAEIVTAAVTVAEAQSAYDTSVAIATAEQSTLVAQARADVAEFMASVSADNAYTNAYRYYKYLNAIRQAYGKAKLVIVGEGVDSSNLYFGSMVLN